MQEKYTLDKKQIETIEESRKILSKLMDDLCDADKKVHPDSFQAETAVFYFKNNHGGGGDLYFKSLQTAYFFLQHIKDIKSVYVYKGA